MIFRKQHYALKKAEYLVNNYKKLLVEERDRAERLEMELHNHRVRALQFTQQDYYELKEYRRKEEEAQLRGSLVRYRIVFRGKRAGTEVQAHGYTPVGERYTFYTKNADGQTKIVLDVNRDDVLMIERDEVKF